MRRKPRSPEGPAKVLRLWTQGEATKALPYLRSVIRSLREHWLDVQGAKQRLRRLDQRPGRADRSRLLERQSAVEESDRAGERFEDTLQELMALDVFCADPVGGLALIPFRQGEELAWLVFDVFDPKGFDAWRFHRDPLDTRRPLSEAVVAPSQESTEPR